MKIGELARAAGCTADTIRFYEKEGLLPQAGRTQANYRRYQQEHVERLRFIRNCRALDMTHDEIRAILAAADGPAKGCATVDGLLDEHIRHVEARIVELQQLKIQLTALCAQCKGGQAVEDCGIMQGLASMQGAPPRPKFNHVG